MKYQCYYNRSIICNGKRYIVERIDTKCFDTEREAEMYCNGHVGFTGDYEEEMTYEEIDDCWVVENVNGDGTIATKEFKSYEEAKAYSEWTLGLIKYKK